jgi:hypothetical protein
LEVKTRRLQKVTTTFFGIPPTTNADLDAERSGLGRKPLHNRHDADVLACRVGAGLEPPNALDAKPDLPGRRSAKAQYNGERPM